jgi:hypothetical protein
MNAGKGQEPRRSGADKSGNKMKLAESRSYYCFATRYRIKHILWLRFQSFFEELQTFKLKPNKNNYKIYRIN